MIKVEKLTKWFGHKKAVSELSFSVSKGDVLGFIGPNGAGKSTTMRVITGFIPASSGNVFIEDKSVDEFPLLAKSKIGYLPENAPLYTNKSVRDFLTFIAEIRGFSGKEKRNKVDEAIANCFLEPVENQIIETLSKGYMHRTCFAQAILHDPDILILDEPTDGLDPNQKCEIRNLIKEMGKSKAIILSTHILEEIEAVTNRVLLISNGEKVFQGTSSELKRESKNAGSILLKVANKGFNDLESVITKVSGVKQVNIIEASSKYTTVRISHIDKGRDKFSHDIMNAATIANWKVSELKEDEGNLEEVFAKLTLQDDFGDDK